MPTHTSKPVHPYQTSTPTSNSPPSLPRTASNHNNNPITSTTIRKDGELSPQCLLTREFLI
eukprot:scaffold285678_cov83-Cyclotella_meneghiniana.AAC.1